ncbi:Outer membrane protein YfgL, lipoprotein component of the protein assembly complex (forms a complex with YaeT, YfiO, and NlpB) [Klebsiella pneumoniae ISC21]|nr:Outer membrane protein YfgL, lipoprotein component of the protein assembly complex (forms a complex with YaeT, YfiO, and NlpB) [Klebsiella pneumoniae ISC21]
MQLRKLLLPGLLSVTLLSGCSLFNSEEDVVKNVTAADGRKPVYAVHVLEHLGWRWYRRILL